MLVNTEGRVRSKERQEGSLTLLLGEHEKLQEDIGSRILRQLENYNYCILNIKKTCYLSYCYNNIDLFIFN